MGNQQSSSITFNCASHFAFRPQNVATNSVSRRIISNPWAYDVRVEVNGKEKFHGYVTEQQLKTCTNKSSSQPMFGVGVPKGKSLCLEMSSKVNFSGVQGMDYGAQKCGSLHGWAGEVNTLFENKSAEMQKLANCLQDTKPTEPQIKNLIVFEWDDILFPTSRIHEIPNHDLLLVKEKAQATLDEAKKHGKVVIVTNVNNDAGVNHVSDLNEQSKFNLNLGGVDIISASSIYKSQDKNKNKKQCFFRSHPVLFLSEH